MANEVSDSMKGAFKTPRAEALAKAKESAPAKGKPAYNPPSPTGDDEADKKALKAYNAQYNASLGE